MTKIATGGHPDLKMVNSKAAAIDIGSTMHMAAVNPEASDMPVRPFGTFTQALLLAVWRRKGRVSSTTKGYLVIPEVVECGEAMARPTFGKTLGTNVTCTAFAITAK